MRPHGMTFTLTLSDLYRIKYECHLVWLPTLPQAGNELAWYWSSGWLRHVWAGDRGAGGASALCTCKLFFLGGEGSIWGQLYEAGEWSR